MSDIRVRYAEPADHQPIISVIDEWWGGRHMADMLPKLFFVHFRPTSFVAEDDGRIVGFLIGFVSQTYPEQAHAHFLGVDPARRGQGLGRRLYEQFFAATDRLGYQRVQAVTSPVNSNSIAFHRRMGFSLLESEHEVDGIPVALAYDGAGEDRMLFSKRLAGAGE